MKQNIFALIEKKGNLPPFPDILLKLQQKIGDINTSITDIAKIIELDVSLAGNILKLANSAFYSIGSQEVKTLPIAINKLGLSKIKQLVYSLKLTSLFSKSKVIDFYQFWQHCLSVAMFTQALASYVKAPREIQDISYLAGLMHDVGIIVFVYLIPSEYSDFLEKAGEKEITLEKQESEYFGCDHQEVGAAFIEKWWLSDTQIINAVRYHHFPFYGTNAEKKCSQIVHIANGICNSQGYTNGINCFHEVFKDGAWEDLGLSLSDVESILQDVNIAISQSSELLGYSSQK
ncbi:MAG: HDOD domain-containing protein [Desulfobacterales bacterium]|nr:HDOD domain-containing protein [Desulfobacterales bacterium]